MPNMINVNVTPRTAREVNKVFAAFGIVERLRQGRGYCYFTEGDAIEWYSSSVPVCYVSDLTIGRWISELEALRTSKRNY